jgi:peptidoglycan/LPS O-acetylase OafA/YrhL
MADSSHKLQYLDGIRGLAALFVFFHHFFLVFYTAYFNFDPASSHLHLWDIRYGQSPLSFISNGNFCVCIFFVLSGLVLSYKYFTTERIEVVVASAQKRFLRLYIPVAFTLVVAFIMVRLHLFFNAPVSAITGSGWWFADKWVGAGSFSGLLHSLYVGTMFRSENTLDTSLWTMTIELAGSFFVFAFLALTHHTRNRRMAIGIVALYLVATGQVYNLLFLSGIGLNYAMRSFARYSPAVVGVLAALLLVSGLVFGSYPSGNDITGTLFGHFMHSTHSYMSYFHAIGAFMVVLAFVISPLLQRFISFRPFRFLGYVSFSLYLIHPLLIGSFSCYLFMRLFPMLGYNAAVLVVFSSTGIVLLLLSWLMARYIDDPGIRLARYVYERWGRKTTPAAG